MGRRGKLPLKVWLEIVVKKAENKLKKNNTNIKNALSHTHSRTVNL